MTPEEQALVKNRWPIPRGVTVHQPCRSCGAAMIWTETSNGKRMPLSVASAIAVAGEQWALPHFVDCKDAKDWRKKPAG
jgi:hypothetical protein